MGESLRAELQPVGELESMLVERIIAAYWRLRRLGQVEAGIFNRELYRELAERARQEARSYEWSILDEMGAAEITDKRKHKEAISKAEEMEAKQDTETAKLGRTFIRDASEANAFSKLSRYETAIERSLYNSSGSRPLATLRVTYRRQWP